MKLDNFYGIFEIAIGILGILLAIYFFIKSLRAKEPCWAIKSKNLIVGYNVTLDNLKILYKDDPIENLTISRICFWNNGQDTIDRNDIETVNRLRIAAKEGLKILDVKVLAQNNLSSQCKVIIDDNGDCVYLDFDYLDNKQGFVIQIIHTGKSSNDIEIIGDIKGVKTLRNKTPFRNWRIISIFRRVIIRTNPKERLVPILLGGITYTVLGIVSIFVPSLSIISNTRTTPPTITENIFFSILLILAGVTITIMGLYAWRRLEIAPKGLDIFGEQF